MTKQWVIRAGLSALSLLTFGPKLVSVAISRADGWRRILETRTCWVSISQAGEIIVFNGRCTHLGCAVPYAKDEDRFHCPCHGSIYDKHTALAVRDPAPRGLDLFHLHEEAGKLTVETNPLNLMVRTDNRWHPEHVEVPDR